MNEKAFELILNTAHDFLQDKGINIVSEKTLMQALPIIIECVEAANEQSLTGEEKKNLVVRIILFILDKAEIDEEKKIVLMELVNGGTLEITIDIIIDASKGKLVLNRKTQMKIFLCFSHCFKVMATKLKSTTSRQSEVNPATTKKHLLCKMFNSLR